MSDEPADRNRPPKYGGPRDETWTPPDSPPRDRGESPRWTRGGPTRRPPDDRPQSRGELPPENPRFQNRVRPQPNDATQRRRYGSVPPQEWPPAFEHPIDHDLLEAFEVLEFETGVQKRVYRYVERQGIASPEEIIEHLDVPAESLSNAIQWLIGKDYLEATDGTLRVAHNTDIERTYTLGGIDVTIRPARQEDLTGLVELIRGVTDERTYVVAESVAAQLAYEETVIRHTDTRSRMFFVATVEDEAIGESRLVGWAHLTVPEIAYLNHTAELTVGVHVDFRRRGIGGRLMRIVLAWAAANGYHKVYQSLPGTNRAAIEFLTNHGWTIEAIRADHYHIGGAFVDEVMMAVTL